MKLPRSWRVRALVSAMALAAVASAALGTSMLLGVTYRSDSSAPLGFGAPQLPFLLTANRDRLAICVDAVGFYAGETEDVEAAAKSAIEAALAEIGMRVALGPPALGVGPPLVATGCPMSPAIFGELGVVESPRSPENALGRVVREASDYRVFVFVMPYKDIRRLTESSPIRVSAEEHILIGDVGVLATTGLYLASEELLDAQFLADALMRALGFKPPFEAEEE